MKKRFFLFIVAFVLVLTLGACHLESKEVELGVSVSYNKEMVEQTAQQVTVEISADSNVDDAVISYTGLNPEVAEISSKGVIKALAPGEAEFKAEVVLGEYSKVIEFKVTVVALEYTISYELNGGENSELNPNGFASSDLPLELQPATKEGYKFLGWEYEGEIIEVIPADTTRNVELAAKWEVLEYAISYDLAGGAHKGEAAVEYTIEDEVVLGEAERKGYTFLGWYAGEEKVEKVEKGSTGDLALEAKWEVVEYAISYDLAGGAHVGEAAVKYTVEEEVVLGAAEKEGARFLGWYAGEEKVEKIAKGSTGEVTLVAKWQEGYEVEFDLAGGAWEGGYATFEEIGEAFLADFNKYGEASLTKESFFANSTPGIKKSFANAEMLAKWQWLFVYMLEDLTAINEGKLKDSYLADTLVALEKIIAGDKEVMSAVAAPGPNARTMIRSYMAGAMNKAKGSTNATFNAYVPDFSVEANQKALLAGHQELVRFVEKDYVLPTPVKEGYVFQGWYAGETKVEKVTADVKLVAKWAEPNQEAEIEFVLDGGKFAEGVEVPATYVEGIGLTTLPAPEKEGYVFEGWYLGETKVEAISAEQTGKVVLTAKWLEKSNENVIYVGPNAEYKTLAEAFAVVAEGAVVRVAAGTYEGATLAVKGVTIEGANAGVNPVKQDRVEETVIVGDLVIAADDVIVDGIKLTELGRIVGGEAGLENLVIRNITVIASTVNPTSADSSIAPLTFASVAEGVTYKNIQIANAKYAESKGRPMIFFGAQVDGLTVIESEFVGTRSNYNDGIKLATSGAFEKAAYGIKGNVTITGNHFENYSQYVIWFSNYQAGEYLIANNEFKECGQTVSSHAAATFSTYSGAADGKVNIRFEYNTVNNAYSLFRLNASDKLANENLSIKVNYNKLSNCAATYYINNAHTYVIDATNNWYDKTPTADKFKNATWEPYYANESDVPAYVGDANATPIKYELNGGTNPAGAPASYNKLAGITSLPVPTLSGKVFVGWYYDGKKVESLEPGLEVSEIVLVAKWREDALYVGTGEDYYYTTIAEALAAAKAGDKIIITAGTYEESFTVSVADLTIVGPNAGGAETRAEEAVLKGAITISAKGLTLDGLAFTGNATITGAQTINFSFVNNYVYDTAEATKAWQEGAGYAQGFIWLNGATNSTLSKNITIANNIFNNVSDANVNMAYVQNVTFDNNVFKNFDRDAIRFDTGGYNCGILSFTNNEFLQDSLGGYNGIYFRIYGGANTNDTTIVIKGNKFVNIGNKDAGLYSGAISARNYQEKGVDIQIIGNHFEKCYNYIRFRNNAKAANHAASTWACKVDGNAFIGLPTSYYFAEWNNSDSDLTQNPILTVFGANYYEDNEGKVITDLAAYESYFKQVANKGTALEAKPALGEGTPVQFYTISYDLQGGTTLESFVYEYSSLTVEAIALPQLSKPNHNFLGWYDGETKVESITGAYGANVHLVARFEALEGEFYNLEFVTTHGNWPTRDAISREEIVAEFYNDFYAWAVANGETKDFASFKANLDTNIAGYKDIKLRNKSIGGYEDETGSTEYFLNSPQYFSKWHPFFLVFREAMFAVNSGQDFYTDDYATMVRLYQFITWSSTGQNYFNSYLSRMYKALQINKEIPTQYQGGQILELPVLTSPIGLEFYGWYDNAEFTGEPVTKIESTSTGDKKFYAKWQEETKPEKVEINKIEKLERYATHQLVWTISPENASNKSVEFFSSNPEVASISSFKGLITAHQNGKTTITMKVYGNREVDVVFELEVYSPVHMEGSYETNSYVKVGDSINLVAKVVGAEADVVWSSADSTIATVAANGCVTGVAAGTTTITAKSSKDENIKLEFIVTVLDGEISEVLEFVLDNHESNVFTRYNLGIGAGVPVYYADIYGSVNKILMNKKLEIDSTRKDKEVESNTGDYFESMTSVEFITVHYTGNMSKGADAEANANYFVGDNAVSIHYTTGNDGVYQCLDHSLGAWHAGDSGALAQVGEFKWIKTGVKVGANDPLYPEFTISQDFYYEINGQKTSVPMPKPWNYDERGTDHILNADGTISSKSTFGQSGFANREAESFINDMGLPFKVENGEYYMGTTWWCYTQVYEGRICSTGGNRNSLGIESCVDQGSDLWMTWQTTAQLVAKLMIDTNLDITRVRGHHFFAAKDCPQPMLENDCEIWREFLELVEAEYAYATEYKDYEISIVSNNTEIVDNHGRVVKTPEFATTVSYTVTISKGGEVVDTVTLASMVPGIYER